MSELNELKYTKTHEWVKVEGDLAYIGITNFAQTHMGDIVYIEVPDTEVEIAQGDELGVIESVKSAATIFSPVSGTIVKVNDDLEGSPELLNQEPYEQYIVAVEMSNPGDLDELMDLEAYNAFSLTEESEG